MEFSQPNLIFLLIFTNFLIFPSCITLEFEVDDETTFTYVKGTGKGPKDWGQINPQWKACENGKMQSPIDLLDERARILPNLGKLKRDYNAAPATIRNRGHDVALAWKGDAGKIQINGTYYKLDSCHWHSPSEHTINGTRYQLELHVIHLSNNGYIAVVGIVFKFGRPDPFLAKILEHVSSVSHEEKDIGIVNPGEIKFGSRKYYRYVGSLTVPPCTEGVTWTIIKKVRTASREQVQKLRDLVHDGFEVNARPIQQLDGRSILLYTPGQGQGQ